MSNMKRFLFYDVNGKKHYEYFIILSSLFKKYHIPYLVYHNNLTDHQLDSITTVIQFNEKVVIDNIDLHEKITKKPIVIIDHGASNLKWFISKSSRYLSVDYFLTAGPKHKESMEVFFDKQDSIISTGFIKSMQLFAEPSFDVISFCQTYGITGKIILYAPTWNTSNNEDIAIIIKQLSTLSNVICSYHPDDKTDYKPLLTNTHIPTSELVKISDIVISDTSSLLYEACALKKKTIQVIMSNYSDNPAKNYELPVSVGTCELFVGGILTLPIYLLDTIKNIHHFQFNTIWQNVSKTSIINPNVEHALLNDLMSISCKTNKTIPKPKSYSDLKQPLVIYRVHTQTDLHIAVLSGAKIIETKLNPHSILKQYPSLLILNHNVKTYHIQNDHIPETNAILITTSDVILHHYYKLQSYGKRIYLLDYDQIIIDFNKDSKLQANLKYIVKMNCGKFVTEYSQSVFECEMKLLYELLQSTKPIFKIMSDNSIHHLGKKILTTNYIIKGNKYYTFCDIPHSTNDKSTYDILKYGSFTNHHLLKSQSVKSDHVIIANIIEPQVYVNTANCFINKPQYTKQHDIYPILHTITNHPITYSCHLAESDDMIHWKIANIKHNDIISYNSKNKYYDEISYAILQYITHIANKKKEALICDIISQLRHHQHDLFDYIEHRIFGCIHTDCRYGLERNRNMYDYKLQLSYLYNYLNSYITFSILKPIQNHMWIVIDGLQYPKLSDTHYIGMWKNKPQYISVTQKCHTVQLCELQTKAHNVHGIQFNKVWTCKIVNTQVEQSIAICDLSKTMFGLRTSYAKTDHVVNILFDGVIYIIPKHRIVDNKTTLSVLHYIYKYNTKWQFVDTQHTSLDIMTYEIVNEKSLYYGKNSINIIQSCLPNLFDEWVATCKMKYIDTTKYVEPECDVKTIVPHNNISLNLKFVPKCNDIIFTHRSGWKYVINLLQSISNNDGVKITFVNFIEKTFSWDYQTTVPNKNVRSYMNTYVTKHNDKYLIKENGVWKSTTKHVYESGTKLPSLPIRKSWIGIWHNPHNMPLWFNHYHSPQSILKRPEFLESLKTCKGIFVLSEYFKSWLSKQIDVPISVIPHPTNIPLIKFDFDKFLKNDDKCLIQIGYWLRRMCSIGLVSTTMKKIWLYGNDWSIACLKMETEHHRKHNELCSDMSDVIKLNVSNVMYDLLLSQNICFVHLYDSSANNAVIECIVRHTPLIINKHPAVVEYLGEDYPLYFSELDEVAKILTDYELIRKGYEYLKNNTTIHEHISSHHFIKQFVESSIVQNLIS